MAILWTHARLMPAVSRIGGKKGARSRREQPSPEYAWYVYGVPSIIYDAPDTCIPSYADPELEARKRGIKP